MDYQKHAVKNKPLRKTVTAKQKKSNRIIILVVTRLGRERYKAPIMSIMQMYLHDLAKQQLQDWGIYS